MNFQYRIQDTLNSNVSALGYNASRREIIAGYEDGTMKAWEAESGIATFTTRAHQGWLTSFCYWPNTKLVISSSNDGKIIFWSGNSMADKVWVDRAIYIIEVNPKRNQLLCGTSSGIILYDLDENKKCGSYVRIESAIHLKHHHDIVKCIAIYENRIFSAGFDQQLISYDATFTSTGKGLQVHRIIQNAHDAGITHLCLAMDSENNAWVVTSGFDKCLKIWSTSGKLIHRIPNFMYAISGLAYLPKLGTIWVAAGSSVAMMFDPKSGENVSEFSDTFRNEQNNSEEAFPEKYHLQRLKYFPEQNILIGSTSRRQIITWKFKFTSSVTTLSTDKPVIGLTYTRKYPILVFSTDLDGELLCWERKPSNHFAYTAESFKTNDSLERLLEKKLLLRERQMEQKSRTDVKTNSNNHVQKTSDVLKKSVLFFFQ